MLMLALKEAVTCRTSSRAFPDEGRVCRAAAQGALFTNVCLKVRPAPAMLPVQEFCLSENMCL